MTNEDKIKKLKLTHEQQKAFNRMKKALDDFKKAGGVLVGSNDFQYALNGFNFMGAHDHYSNNCEKNYISLDDADMDSIQIKDPFNDAPPYIEVKA